LHKLIIPYDKLIKMWKRSIVSAVMPVFNEEKTVKRVVEVLVGNPQVDEVVVIDDGSSDDSLAILKKFATKIKLISIKKNKGKGWAVAKGLRKASGEIILLTDADLVNFNDDYIKKLLEPMGKNGVEVVVGCLRKGKYVPAPFARLTGERVYYKKDLLPHLKEMRATRFGLEIFLNHLFKDKKIKKVSLVKLQGLYKYEKFSAKVAVKEYLNEGLEIARELAKQERLMPSDLKIIEKLKKVSKVSEWKEKAKMIKNQRVRRFLQKYVMKYLPKRMSRRYYES